MDRFWLEYDGQAVQWMCLWFDVSSLMDAALIFSTFRRGLTTQENGLQAQTEIM